MPIPEILIYIKGARDFVIGLAIASPLYFAIGTIVACIINAVSFLVFH